MNEEMKVAKEILMTRRAKQIINTLEPYVNGKLITCVFEKYFKELKDIIESYNINLNAALV